MIHTYTHRFASGAVATAFLTDDPPGYRVEWQGRLSSELLPEYFKWRATILEDFTTRTGKNVLVVDLK